MSNIVGEDHLDYVKDQIRTRQEILGKSEKSPFDINWENSTTGWVRLMSSVDIKDQDILVFNEENPEQDEVAKDGGAKFRNEFLGLKDYNGNRLAKELVLQGGTLNNTQARFGVTIT